MNFDHWGNPDSWMDVLDHLLLVLGVWGGIFITVGLPVILGNRRQLKTANEGIAAVRESTVNDHEKPLRVDLDERFDQLDDAIEKVHTEVRDEREERRDRMRDLRGDIDARIGGLHRRIDEIAPR